MTENLKSVAQLIDERPDEDSSELFDAMADIVAGLRTRIDERFELEPDPSTEPFHTYGGEPGVRGSLRGFTGPEVDWMIQSWVGNPQASFTNQHLTVWLGQHVEVPHLGFAFGTLPDPWLLIDFPPRRDTALHPDYLDRYYDGEPNEKWLRIKQRDDLRWFTSQSVEVRQALSVNAYVYLMDRDLSSVEFMRDLANEELTRWFGWLDDAEPVPVDERAALAERDLQYRRNVAERDPANIVIERALGKDTEQQLVQALWGGNRALPRPLDR